jgi:hypothetical protein
MERSHIELDVNILRNFFGLKTTACRASASIQNSDPTGFRGMANSQPSNASQTVAPRLIFLYLETER